MQNPDRTPSFKVVILCSEVDRHDHLKRCFNARMKR